jgi:2,4-dienoyl-CoA reductase-like NADH-dependent reductase (Old Yellow Enzyme family)
MEELLGGDGDPNSSHFKLYEEWAKGDWGMVLTGAFRRVSRCTRVGRADAPRGLLGNVMVSPTHLGSPGDIVVPCPESKTFDRSVGIFKEWAVASHAGGSKAPVIMQLCHTGTSIPSSFGAQELTREASQDVNPCEEVVDPLSNPHSLPPPSLSMQATVSSPRLSVVSCGVPPRR